MVETFPLSRTIDNRSSVFALQHAALPRVLLTLFAKGRLPVSGNGGFVSRRAHPLPAPRKADRPPGGGISAVVRFPTAPGPGRSGNPARFPAGSEPTYPFPSDWLREYAAGKIRKEMA